MRKETRDAHPSACDALLAPAPRQVASTLLAAAPPTTKLRPMTLAKVVVCRIERAVLDTIAEGKHLTRDLGGKSGTSDFTQAIIGELDD